MRRSVSWCAQSRDSKATFNNNLMQTWHYTFGPHAPQTQVLCGFLNRPTAATVEDGPRCAGQSAQLSATQVDISQINQFAEATIQDCFSHEHSEILGLLKVNARRHDELLPRRHDVYQCRPGMIKCGTDRAFKVVGVLGPKTLYPHRFCHRCKVGV